MSPQCKKVFEPKLALKILERCVHTHTHIHRHTHFKNTDTEAAVTATWHQMSPCDVFLSFVSVSIPFSAVPPPPTTPIPLSLSLCAASSCFERGNYLIHTQDTQCQQTTSYALQRYFSLPILEPPLASIMRRALLMLLQLGTDHWQQLRGGVKICI